MENPIKMDDLGGKHHYFWVDTHMGTRYVPWVINLFFFLPYQNGNWETKTKGTGVHPAVFQVFWVNFILVFNVFGTLLGGSSQLVSG